MLTANPIPLDIELFRKMFPAFSDEDQFPDELIQMKWDLATCYVSDRNGGRLHGTCRQSALNYMTAHLLRLDQLIAQAPKIGNNGQPGIVTGATVDKVSVTLLPPPVADAWDWWLQQTPYGAALLALLEAKGVGGFYVGGLPEREAFRKVYGTFRNF